MIWMSLLLSLAVSLPLVALNIMQLILSARREREWTRIFSVKSLEIPGTSMDGKIDEVLKLPRPDTRKRMSVPIPMPDSLRAAMSMRREK